MSQSTGRKQLVGKVVSNGMMQTLVVEVTRLVRHPIYKRVVRRNQKYKVHVTGDKPRVGDEVRIEETRPISKDKRWRLIEVERAAAVTE